MLLPATYIGMGLSIWPAIRILVLLNGGVIALMGPDRIMGRIYMVPGRSGNSSLYTYQLYHDLSIRLMFVNIQDATLSHIDRPAPTSVDRSARSADFPLS